MSDTLLILAIDRLCQRIGADHAKRSKEFDEICGRMDALICHFSAVDADYGRMLNTLRHHEARLNRLEKDHQYSPEEKIGESSALYAAMPGTSP